MKVSLIKCAGTVLLASSVVMAPMASAAMVSTQDAVSAQQLQNDRDKIRSFLDRATVKDRLQAMGVQASVAKDRINALTDSEVELLAQKIDSLPAGASLGTMDIVLILLVAILVAVLV